MLCEKCVILCFVVVYAVHCFGSIVKKIVGCSSNFVMMMLYYIDMCVCVFVCLFVLGYAAFLFLYDFVGQITWYQYIYDMHFWVYFDIYIYIHYVLLGRTIWVSLRSIHLILVLRFWYVLLRDQVREASQKLQETNLW